MGQANRHLARVLAIQGLYQYMLLKTSTEEVKACDWHVEEPVNPETRAYASSLIEGTITHITNIEEMIRSKLDKSDLDHIRIMDKTVLTLSVYTLMYCRDVPATVVINEAVILAKEFGNYNSYKFINGVLDAVSRNPAAV